MNIRFEEINKDNWINCIMLTTNPNKENTLFEEFVASNAVSIAQSKAEDGWITKAVYDGDKMVGFVMYGYSYKDDFYEICRIMIDYGEQRKGYGKRALEYTIDEMKQIKECREIFLSFDEDNNIARKLYEAYGFKDTCRLNDDEVLYSLKL